jgi:hypothetical protein
MMLRPLCLFVLSMLLLACSSSTREEQAAESAKACYELLAADDVIRFMEQKAGVDTLDSDYAEQLLQAVRQYQSDIRQKHGGIRAVEVSPNIGSTDTTFNVTHAFLLISYADSTQEEISVPMVEHQGRWLMK